MKTKVEYCEFCYIEHTLPLCTVPSLTLEGGLDKLAEAINELKDVLVDAIAKKDKEKSEAIKVTPDDLVVKVKEWIEDYEVRESDD